MNTSDLPASGPQRNVFAPFLKEIGRNIAGSDAIAQMTEAMFAPAVRRLADQLAGSASLAVQDVARQQITSPLLAGTVIEQFAASMRPRMDVAAQFIELLQPDADVIQKLAGQLAHVKVPATFDFSPFFAETGATTEALVGKETAGADFSTLGRIGVLLVAFLLAGANFGWNLQAAGARDAVNQLWTVAAILIVVSTWALKDEGDK